MSEFCNAYFMVTNIVPTTVNTATKSTIFMLMRAISNSFFETRINDGRITIKTIQITKNCTA